ncbi:MAG TPA: hypothetical protein VFR86_07385 [Burkholderiaceae bacterium]|nr:hypothetical protein [Burkholderiaceae bacterium]
MPRAYHRYDVLWRWVHQPHHAPQQLAGFEDAAGTRLARLFDGRDANAAVYGPRNRGRIDPAGNPG